MQLHQHNLNKLYLLGISGITLGITTKPNLKHLQIPLTIPHKQHLITLRILYGRYGVKPLELYRLVALTLLGEQEMHIPIKEPSQSD